MWKIASRISEGWGIDDEELGRHQHIDGQKAVNDRHKSPIWFSPKNFETTRSDLAGLSNFPWKPTLSKADHTACSHLFQSYGESFLVFLNPFTH